jgi:hypothetical protein
MKDAVAKVAGFRLAAPRPVSVTIVLMAADQLGEHRAVAVGPQDASTITLNQALRGADPQAAPDA